MEVLQICQNSQSQKMNNIIITSAGKRVSLVQAFQNELKVLIPNQKVFTADANPSLAAACMVSDHSFSVPRLDNLCYIDELVELCIKNNIRLIIPTVDTELLLLSENKEKFISYNINPVISSISFIKNCRDKRKIHTFFKDHNIDVANEYSKTNYNLPLFIKPIDGSRSVNNYIIKSESDFIDLQFKNDDLIFLEYFDNKEFQEYTCDLYYGRDDQLKCVVPRKRIEVRDGEVIKGKTEKNILVDYIQEKLDVIKGARGCLTAQFFKRKDSNEIVGIEINPRFGGGYPLSYQAGANYPKWIIEEYLLNKSINPYDGWQDNLLMLRYDKEIFLENSNA